MILGNIPTIEFDRGPVQQPEVLTGGLLFS
jgi:hypothetical protein